MTIIYLNLRIIIVSFKSGLLIRKKTFSLFFHTYFLDCRNLWRMTLYDENSKHKERAGCRYSLSKHVSPLPSSPLLSPPFLSSPFLSPPLLSPPFFSPPFLSPPFPSPPLSFLFNIQDSVCIREWGQNQAPSIWKLHFIHRNTQWFRGVMLGRM